MIPRGSSIPTHLQLRPLLQWELYKLRYVGASTDWQIREQSKLHTMMTQASIMCGVCSVRSILAHGIISHITPPSPSALPCVTHCITLNVLFKMNQPPVGFFISW